MRRFATRYGRPHPFWIPPRHGSHQVQNKRRECDPIDNVSPPQQHELSFPILDLSHRVSWFGLYRLGSECNDLTRLYAWAHPCTICATRLLDKEFNVWPTLGLSFSHRWAFFLFSFLGPSVGLFFVPSVGFLFFHRWAFFSSCTLQRLPRIIKRKSR